MRVELQPLDGNRLRAPGFIPANGKVIVVTEINKATGPRSFATYQY